MGMCLAGRHLEIQIRSDCCLAFRHQYQSRARFCTALLSVPRPRVTRPKSGPRLPHFTAPQPCKRRLPARLGCRAMQDQVQKGLALTDYVRDKLNGDLVEVFDAFQDAVQKIATKLSRAGIEDALGSGGTANSATGRDDPKKMDVVANELLKEAFVRSGKVAVMASEEDEEAVEVDNRSSAQFAAVFDPLDGSSNIAACIPTGTILGIYSCTGPSGASKACLQPGSKLLAAAYALYSSATMIVLSLGSGVVGFTLDSTRQEFLLTHHIQIPQRGQMYSLNDARQFDWPPGLRRYIDDVRQGKGQTGKQYAARYICSLVADFHRTLLYGGWAGNPRSHLRLVYEANPLSFLAEQAGGSGSTGKERVLGIQPEALHQRLPLFMGSPEDIAELEGYGDVQQTGSKKYSV